MRQPNYDMARSYLETLIEQLTGVDSAIADDDDDYFMTVKGVGLFARVDGPQYPVFRLFSVVTAKVDPTNELFSILNDINTQLAFLRTMFIDGQVLIEGDLLPIAATQDSFIELCDRIAHASDHFGPILLDKFGGQPLFEASKSSQDNSIPGHFPGYL
jgi:hypothetical protein